MIRILLAGCLTFVLVTARADIEPTQYTGFGLSPVKAQGLRMASARVDITWGLKLCNITANFIIDNPTSKPVDIDLGFPVQGQDSAVRVPTVLVPKELTFAFNDVAIVPASIAINDPVTQKLVSIKIAEIKYGDRDLVGSIQLLCDKSREFDPEHKGVKFVLRPEDKKSLIAKDAKIRAHGGSGNFSLAESLNYIAGVFNLDYAIEGDTVYLRSKSGQGRPLSPDEYTWFRCHHTFAPGPTKVTITTSFPASAVYNYEFRETLYYCIETGGAWDGNIGSEEVDIHFPGPISKEQIFEAKPDGYTIAGNTVRWLFKDFKPKGNDHDIEIEYLRPDVIPTLARLRADLDRDPSNPALALKLARNLFALGDMTGYAPFPPSDLSLSELNSFIATIKNERDRASMRSFYSVDKDLKYSESEDSWNTNREETLRILNSIDYQPPIFKSPYVDEARSLVEKVLLNHPTNAEAWNIYFANYFRFRFAGGRYEIGDPHYYPDEIAQIKKAIALCPDDPGLKLWYAIMTNPQITDPGLPPIKTLFEQIKKQGIYENDFEKTSD